MRLLSSAFVFTISSSLLSFIMPFSKIENKSVMLSKRRITTIMKTIIVASVSLLIDFLNDFIC